MIFQLLHYGSLSISGADAKKFLQGQLTCNLDKLEPHKSLMGAHCNPKGRIISLFHCLYHDHTYTLIMPRDMIAIAESALKKYAPFFKVSCANTSDHYRFDGVTVDELATTQNQYPVVLISPKLAIIMQPNSDNHREGASTTWDQQLIAEKIPVITPETSQTFLPHELNLEDFNAISFEKGCYTGQEIIARMHYRSQVKYHLYQATTQTETRLTPGLDVYGSQKQVVGRIVNSVKLAQQEYQLLMTMKDPVTTQPIHLNNEDPIQISLNI